MSVRSLAAVLASGALFGVACQSSGSAGDDPAPVSVDADVGVDVGGGSIGSSGGSSGATGTASDDTDVPPDAGSDAGDASGSPDAGGGPDGGSAATANARADSAVEAMLLHFWDQSLGYLDATEGTSSKTGYWTFAQAWDAVLDAAERNPGRFLGTVETFYDAQAASGWSSNFFDDENWMTLALLRSYDLTGEEKYLTQAKSLYAEIEAAWDTTCCGSTPGGIWWDRKHTQKATAINAGAVVSGSRLYARTKDAAYLTFAQKAYAFWRANMVNASTFQVTDHIDSDGSKKFDKFTYDQGLMIGAGVELDKAAPNASASAGALALSGDIATFMGKSEVETTPSGAVLTDGNDSTCKDDCAQFKGIGARYLADLYAADSSRADLASLLVRCADGAWVYARDASSGVFAVDWGAAYQGPAILNATSSAAMALSAAAVLAGPARASAGNTYEAEEGVLHGVGLEAAHAGFSGWGYVAGWTGDKQWVDFLVKVPAAGTYTLTFRYAAAGGDASREIDVDGATLVADEAFPATADWSTYAKVTARAQLTAGANTVSVIYGAALGSKQPVNLDALTVEP